MPLCDKWLVLDNMDLMPEIIAEKNEFGEVVQNDEIWKRIYTDYYGKERR